MEAKSAALGDYTGVAWSLIRYMTYPCHYVRLIDDHQIWRPLLTGMQRQLNYNSKTDDSSRTPNLKRYLT